MQNQSLAQLYPADQPQIAQHGAQPLPSHFLCDTCSDLYRMVQFPLHRKRQNRHRPQKSPQVRRIEPWVLRPRNSRRSPSLSPHRRSSPPTRRRQCLTPRRRRRWSVANLSRCRRSFCMLNQHNTCPLATHRPRRAGRESSSAQGFDHAPHAASPPAQSRRAHSMSPGTHSWAHHAEIHPLPPWARARVQSIEAIGHVTVFF